MKTEEQSPHHLKGENPFKVPEGYFEGLTDQIMSRLPEKEYDRPRKTTVYERVRPWLYMAAIFIGLALFIRTIIGFDASDASAGQLAYADSAEIQSVKTVALTLAEENADYLEYLETQYTGYILAEEMDDFE